MLLFLCVFTWEKNCGLLLKKCKKNCFEKYVLSVIFLLWTNIWRKINLWLWYENMIFPKTDSLSTFDCQMVFCKLNTDSISLPHTHTHNVNTHLWFWTNYTTYFWTTVFYGKCIKSNSGLGWTRVTRCNSKFPLHNLIAFPVLYNHHAIKY